MKFKHYMQAACVTTAAVAFMTQAPITTNAQFFDVSPNSESGTAIQKLTALNIANGYTDQTFKPKNSITRAEAAKMMAALHLKGGPIPTTASASFSDVPSTHWAAQHIAYANEQQWLTGYGDGRFGSSDVVTRGQFAKILAQYLGETVPNIELPFTDVAKGSWYEDGVKTLLSLNITTGTSATTFSPNQPITREQFAIFLDRAKLLGDTVPNNTVTTEPTLSVPTTISLEALADPNKTYGLDVFMQLIAKTYTPENDGFRNSDTYSPSIYEYGRIDKGNDGSFIYSYSTDYQTLGAQYIFYVTFENQQFKHFKLYSSQQFEQLATSYTSGHSQIGALIHARTNGKPENYYISFYDHTYTPNNDFKLSSSTWYFEKLHTGKSIVNIGYAEVQDRSNILFHVLEITHEHNGMLTSISVKPLQSLLTLHAPKQHLLQHIIWLNPTTDEERPIYTSDETKNTIKLYALTPTNEPIPTGAKIEVSYFDYRLHTYDNPALIKEYYTFDGYQFVKN